jgi:transcriptional regulator GlxA family with amidase domain
MPITDKIAPIVHRVVVLGLDRLIPFDLATPFQVFGDARGADNEQLYDVVLAGRRRGALPTSGGFSIVAPHGLSRLEQADTIVVVGSEPAGVGVDDRIRRVLRQAHRRGSRLLSICTGAFVLAECGILDGRRATTHWRYSELFSKRYPRVDLDPAVLFVHDDDNLLTSAGAAAGIDLCLYVIFLDHGAGVANRAARSTVSAPHRSGGQAQFIERPLAAEQPRSLEATRRWALEHLAEPLGLDRLARQAAISRRTLVRRFADEMGTTPLQWLIEQRIFLARQLLEQTDLPIDHVARHSGFGSAPTLRLHFRRTLGTSPKAYRDSFGGDRA